MQCPKCDSQYVVKNGHTHRGKQNFKYRDCARQFVMNPRHQPISKSTRQLIDRLLYQFHKIVIQLVSGIFVS